MLLQEDEKRKRRALSWVSFDKQGYAEGWYFRVHDAFKPALDIYHVERIDSEKTKELRDKVSLKLTGLSHDAYKKKVNAERAHLSPEEKKKLPKPPEHDEISKHSIKVILETEGFPMLFSFRPTDGLESSNGEWYVQIGKAIPATMEGPGQVSFNLYEKNRDPSSGLAWSQSKWVETTQADFVRLLRTGHCEAVNLLGASQLALI